MDLENEQTFAKKLATIEANSQLTVLSSMNHQTADSMQQYIVYTDYKADFQQQKTNSIFVYTPFANVDKFGHDKVDYQAQLLFETNLYKKQIHITVVETLGAESRLAFYDFQNLGLAQLALKALINLAKKESIATISGNISTFDHNCFEKMQHILQKNQFEVELKTSSTGRFTKMLNELT